MSRPKPKVLLRQVDSNNKSIEILAAESTWSVFYKNKPMQVKTMANIDFEYPGPKYVRVNFQNPAHAFRLCDKLNQLFNTDDFTVVLMDSGTPIQRP